MPRRAAPCAATGRSPVRSATASAHLATEIATGICGIDFPVGAGTLVQATGIDTPAFAGFNNGGSGNLVVVAHRLGYTSYYAHLSRISSWVGESVIGGTRLGYVGSTGNATGPHLHFEVRLNGTPIDPVPYLLPTTAVRAASAWRCPPAAGTEVDYRTVKEGRC